MRVGLKASIYACKIGALGSVDAPNVNRYRQDIKGARVANNASLEVQHSEWLGLTIDTRTCSVVKYLNTKIFK